jgi:hypothetical protein
MIVEWLAGVAMDLAVAIANLFPGVVIPDFMLDGRQALYGFLAQQSGLGVWFDFVALTVALAATSAVYAIALTVRLIRAAVAHVPQFGGAGA